MLCDARQHALQHLVWLAELNGAAAFVGERDHAIDIGKLSLEVWSAKSSRNISGHRCRTIDRGNDAVEAQPGRQRPLGDGDIVIVAQAQDKILETLGHMGILSNKALSCAS